MNDEIVLYTNPMSRGQIAHWMLEEVGAPYRIELLSFERKEQKRPEYLRINPMGKVPTIVHRGTVITEVGAICAYLADVFPEAGLAPAISDAARGTYLRWLMFTAGCVEPALAEKTLKRPPVPSSTVAWGSYDDVVRTLEHALTPGPYILGDRFSAADVYVGSAVGWAMMTGGLAPTPQFTAYHERLNQRPANQRVQAQSEALLRQLSA